MKTSWRYPAWLSLPDPIVDHCTCCAAGTPAHPHCRSWTLARALRVFAAAGLRP